MAGRSISKVIEEKLYRKLDTKERLSQTFQPRVSDDEDQIMSNHETRKRPSASDEGKEGVTKVARLQPGIGSSWTEETHRAFVTAVYDVGMKHASPAVILDNMQSRPSSITSERVKSHLQKYRLNRRKGKEEFMSGYDNWMTKALSLSEKSESGSIAGANLAFILDMMRSTLPVPGDHAALLSFSIMMKNKPGADTVLGTKRISNDDEQGVKGDDDHLHHFNGLPITFPSLTEDEKVSTLGIGMCYVLALFVNMTEHLEKVRSAARGPECQDPDSTGPDVLESKQQSSHALNYPSMHTTPPTEYSGHYETDSSRNNEHLNQEEYTQSTARGRVPTSHEAASTIPYNYPGASRYPNQYQYQHAGNFQPPYHQPAHGFMHRSSNDHGQQRSNAPSPSALSRSGYFQAGYVPDHSPTDVSAPQGKNNGSASDWTS